MPYTTRRNSKAFSLIELLVVISIIAVLLAVILPSISSARETAKRAVCASQLRQSGIVLSQYADANKEWYIGTGSQREFHVITGFTRTSRFWEDLQSLGWNFKILNCPSGAFKTHFDGTDPTLVINYYYNGGLGADSTAAWYGYDYVAATDPVTHRPIPKRTMTNLPYDTPLMSDMIRGQITNSSTTPGIYARYSETVTLHNYVAPNHFTGTDTLMRSSGGNLMAVDLSVKWKSMSDLTYRFRRQYQWLYW